VLMHELTEMFLCIDRGVSFKAIDQFDVQFKGTGEPGDDLKAPYHREHRFATRVERPGACVSHEAATVPSRLAARAGHGPASGTTQKEGCQ
jgi:hypothetical protein